MARPSYSPTKAQRAKVAIAAGSGAMSHEEIAIGLGISRNTLEKHFAEELSRGAYEKRLGVLDAMHKMAMKGNVSAQKAFLALQPAVAAPPTQAQKPAKLGKKEQANEEAKTAAEGTEWGDLLPGNVVQLKR